MDIDLSQFSDRERAVIDLLITGKSNKEIAHELHIAERTVESHLTHIYAKLGARSRTEASLILAESLQTESISKQSNGRRQASGTFRRNRKLLISLGILLTAVIILVILAISRPEPWQSYEREGENPDEHTVGQTLDRTNAIGLKVHGQFGTICCWPGQPGYVKYDNIRTPALKNLYLQLRYSKYSSSTVPILIYVDTEPNPRARLYPVDQGDWNNFAWTDPIFLGEVRSGVHSITFSTEGQQYGVADLDKFVLTEGLP